MFKDIENLITIGIIYKKLNIFVSKLSSINMY